jgi:uncharacterized membrane protein YraQ (UPF0718 family)
MFVLIITVALCLMVSLIANVDKTFRGITRGIKMFLGILPALLLVLILVSVFLYLVPDRTIIILLGKRNDIFGTLIAALVGAIALIPGFVAFPLAKILLDRGVSYSVIAVFITTLVMVGIITLPMEIKYFGKKAAIMRNVLSFIGALIIGALMGMFL